MDSSHTNQPTKHAYNWPLFAQFMVLFTLMGVLFQASIAPLFARWIKWDQDLSHGIPTLVAFLFLIARSQTLPYRKDARWLGALLIASLLLLSLCWLLFVIANITILANITLLACILTLVAASYSLTSARFLVPLLGILVFTIPLFGETNNLLVAMSAYAVGGLVKLVGMTALIDGQSIFIPSGHIYIADGCSGLRYFTIAIFLGYTLSILNNYRLKQAILALLIAASLGLFTNWLRIFALVIIGDVTEMKSSLMHDHEFFGWILFSCVMFPAIYFAPIKPHQPIPALAPPLCKPVLPLLALLSGPLLLALIPNNSQNHHQLSLQLLAPAMQQSPAAGAFQLQVPAGQTQAFAQKSLAGTQFQLQLTQYQPSSLKEKIVPYFEQLYRNEEWRSLGSSAQQPNPLAAQGFNLLRLANARTAEYRLLIYRFEVGSYNTGRYQTAKLLQIPATLLGDRYANFFSLHSRCKDAQCSAEIAAATALALEWDKITQPLR
jgi:exosortase